MISSTFQTTFIVRVDYTVASSIRCTARQDMPEYGLKVSDIFYLVRSSKNNGDYYLVRWNYEQISWQCSCTAATTHCRHTRLVSARCCAQVKHAALALNGLGAAIRASRLVPVILKQPNTREQSIISSARGQGFSLLKRAS